MTSQRPSASSTGSSTRFNVAKMMEEQKRKRVLIVGAGAAGMSCAEHLSNHPDKFDVTLVESSNYCGGQAFSIPIDKEKYGASWLNQGVQGGSYIFHHTMTMFSRCGYSADPVNLQVSFGKGEKFWTNMFPTVLLKKHAGEVKRFYTMLYTVKYLSPFFAILPISILLKLFGFSTDFANLVALSSIALFLGTGNYTPEVPSIVLERIFTSPTYGMWYPPSKRTIVENVPSMVVFPNFTEFYTSWKDRLTKKGVSIRLSTEVTRVVKRDSKGVVVKVINRTPVEDGHNPNSAWASDSNVDADAVEMTEEYDEIVLCVLTDTAKRLLTPTITWNEKRILGAAIFSDDITVTHSDVAFIKKHLQWNYDENLAIKELNGQDCSERMERGKKDFKPMYFIKPYEEDSSKLEMHFDCSLYQSQFPPSEAGKIERHVFQSIFLNKDRDSKLWPIDEIDESKIIRKDWWHQLCHSYTHYLRVVPWMWTIQGKRHTRYAASWTLLNAHEVACISGISAAVHLGADYPDDLERDRFSFLAFRCYYMLVYGSWYRRRFTKHSKEGTGKDWAEGEHTYGSTYRGPGVSTVERLTWQKEVEAGRSLKSFD